jgi:hypothetical protein
MILERQTRFSLPLANDVRLVSMETARAGSGETAEVMTEWAEDDQCPDHLPAFNLAVRAGLATDDKSRREIFFWAGALRNGHWRQRATPETLLDSIIADCLLTNLIGLPNREINLPGSRLECAWTVSNQHVIRLIAAAEIKGVRVGRNWKVNRASAAEFLRRRAL